MFGEISSLGGWSFTALLPLFFYIYYLVNQYKKGNNILKNLVIIGFCQNYWITIHILGGVVGASIFPYLLNRYTSLSYEDSRWVSFWLIGVIAIVFEIVQYYILKSRFYADWQGGIDWALTKYKTKKKWKYDTAGDIISVIIVSAIILTFAR